MELRKALPLANYGGHWGEKNKEVELYYARCYGGVVQIPGIIDQRSASIDRSINISIFTNVLLLSYPLLSF